MKGKEIVIDFKVDAKKEKMIHGKGIKDKPGRIMISKSLIWEQTQKREK